MQTRGWAEAKALTGWRAERYVLGGGLAQVLLKDLPAGLTMAYCARGPLVPAAAAPDAIASLRRSLRDRRCAALLCDPEIPPSDETWRALAGAGIRRAPVFVQPRRTLLLDPSWDPDAMLAAMRKKTRQYIRKAERAGVATEDTSDLGRFHRLLRGVGERDRFAVRSLPYFEHLRAGLGERLHVLMATAGGDDVGGLMLARMGDRAWELYGGWSGTHGEDRPFYLLKWRAIRRMAQLGVRRYDMWGLSDPRSGGALPRTQVLDLVASRLGLRARGTVGDQLTGVDNFKLGFGGAVVEWIGALETPVTPWLFPLWQVAGRRRLARAAA